MNITLSATFTGAPDADDVLGARHAIFLENREINAQNSVLASQVPPGTPLPLLATDTPANTKASYLTVLAKRLTAAHTQYIADGKSSGALDVRFTAAQIDQIRTNLMTRLNAGESAASIVTDTATL